MEDKKSSKKYSKVYEKSDDLREISILDAMELLGLYAKLDRQYKPRNDSQAQRFHVSLESGEVVELLVTGQKWYDIRAMQGGGGAIDLVMHLYGESFPQAVQRLHGLQASQDKVDVRQPPSAKARQAPKQASKEEKEVGEEVPLPCRHLMPVRKGQEEFFVADILDWIPKDDMTSMEHPLFALKAGDRRVRVYERNGCKVVIEPSSRYGLATIHDKDLWIYCISLLVAAKNRGEVIGRTVRFVMKEFLRMTNRPTSGVGYQRAHEMLRRLKGTVIETNIKTAEISERRGFGLIDSWRVVEKSPDNERMVAVEVTLSDWLFRSIDSMQVLTLSQDYFRLRKPIDRRIYELARKHCGQQEAWRVSMAVLYEKSGSSAALRDFRIDVRKLVESGELPDYFVTYEKDTDMVIFSARNQQQEQQN